MIIKSLTPRLNYHFSLSDFFKAIIGVFISKKNDSGFGSYFPDSKIYFTNHARTGLRILLSSLQLPKDSKVGVLVYNCLTVFESINLAGYMPVFIDSTNDYKIDINDLKRKEKELDALIVTHLFGIHAEIEAIKKIMGNKPIIEDCAHSFLNKFGNKYLGSFGDASIFSFGHAKFPAAAEGGIVVINDQKIESSFHQNYIELKEKNIIVQIKDVFKAFFSAILMKKFIYGIFTYKLKQNVGEKDINNKYVFHERKVNKGFYEVFKKRFKDINELKRLQNNNSISIYDSFETNIPNKNRANFMIPLRVKNAKTLIEKAIKNDIEFGQHFSKSILWAEKYGYQKGDCKNTEKLIDETVTIPCYYRLTQKNITKIRQVLNMSENKNDLYR